MKHAVVARVRNLISRHKKASWIVLGLLVANEIRGIIVVSAILKAGGAF